MSLKLTLEATGNTQDDIVTALKEALRRIDEGNTSGFDQDGQGGSFNFNIDGEEEVPEDSEDD